MLQSGNPDRDPDRKNAILDRDVRNIHTAQDLLVRVTSDTPGGIPLTTSTEGGENRKIGGDLVHHLVVEKDERKRRSLRLIKSGCWRLRSSERLVSNR
jgi:hypothetical protein